MHSDVTKTTQRFSDRIKSRSTPVKLVCLNFKVPMQIRQEFKVYAAQHGMTMTELLLQLLDDRLGVEWETPSKRSDSNNEINAPPPHEG